MVEADDESKLFEKVSSEVDDHDSPVSNDRVKKLSFTYASEQLAIDDEDEEAEAARKRNLEKRWRRRLVWGSASGAVLVGGLLSRLGLRGGYYKVMRGFMKFVTNNGLLHLPHIRHSEAVIAGVKVRIYRPLDEDSLTASTVFTEPKRLPAIVYCHGGGWIMGSARSYHSLTTRLSRDTGAIVVSVDYRLAPEFPYPAALDDCLAVTRALLSISSNVTVISDPELKNEIDPHRIAIAGDSAGGNLACCTALELARNGDNRLDACALICPVSQAVTMFHNSAQKYTRHYGKANLGWFLSMYAGVSPNRKMLRAIYNDLHVPEDQQHSLLGYVIPSDTAIEVAVDEIDVKKHAALLKCKTKVPEAISELVATVRAWPLLAEDSELAMLPKTLVQSCSHDVLRDENRVLVDRLRNSGAMVTHSYLKRSQHCEAVNCGMFRSKASRQGYRQVADFLKVALTKDEAAS